MSRHLFRCGPLLLLLTFAACASTGTGGEERPEESSRNFISQAEVEGVESSYNNVYQMVESLRPMWVRSRGAMSGRSPEASLPQVFVDGARFGDLQSLRGIDVRNVESVRYLSPSDATTRYGTGFPGGIIMVNTRRG